MSKHWPPPTIVSVATAGHHHSAVDALVAAFAEDPTWSATLSGRPRRISVLRTALSVLSTDASLRGSFLVALIEGEVAGAAVGWPPFYHPSPLRTLRHTGAALALLRHAGMASVPLFRRWRALHAADPTDSGHWHLAALGVRPDAQRRGVGRALLDAFLEPVDGSGGAAYLETSRPDILAWYGAVGFRVRERVSLPGGRTAWTMWRPPATIPRQSLPTAAGC
ncbi:MAG: GNAT family N-acetyltransferase [Candidatus Limnocylindria bacterium]